MLTVICVTFFAGAALAFVANAKLLLPLVPFVALLATGTLLVDSGSTFLLALAIGVAIAVALQLGYFSGIVLQALAEPQPAGMSPKNAASRLQGTQRQEQP